MSKKKDLYILYKFQTIGEGQGKYWIILSFDQYGEVNIATHEKGMEHFIFDNQKQLEDFISDLMQKSSHEIAHLLSLNDYNIGLESTQSLQNFQKIFLDYGLQIVNKSTSERSFFSKIF